MTDEDDRRAITAAMQRLFAGTPLRSSGKLDIVSLAQEAGVKRNKLTHRHTDLKDLFYAQRENHNRIPDNEVRLREQIADLEQYNQTLRDERDRYRLTSETFARALHVLTVENDNLRRDPPQQSPHRSSRPSPPRLIEHLEP
ncbi:hypothetical protein [Rhodococcus sp. H29-C3]|uniref:hypothetical protein n=1 Tax=Rhodococcus sp. H29-C3 TaxID=3046307 RepID=UPI0024B9B5A9|nr:hypothetical protein [Rhodococcus sp. H29-C3]MDJ0363221.1 hypothetical protein [Rhodococcus sp. H29-C3]